MRCLSFWCCIALAALAGSAEAGRGAAELALDRGAVLELLTLGLPGPQRLELPAVGAIELSLSAPDTVHLRDGGIEANLGFAIAPLGLEGSLDVRLVPGVDTLSGTVRLVPEWVRPRTAVRGAPRRSSRSGQGH